MARARSAEHQRPRSKIALIEEITHGINKLQEVLAAINDISKEGFPYRDAAQSKAELQFRECLRQTFDERSDEFQTYRTFKIRTGDKTEVAQTRTIIKDLVHTLEDRKLELQGLKPPLKTEPPREESVNNSAPLVLTSPATSTTVPAQAATPISPVPPLPQTQSIAPALQIPTPILTPTSTSIPTPPPTSTADPVLDRPSISLSRIRLIDSTLDPALDQDPIHLIRKICHRFHAVARQLHLRRDYRPTLEVDDDYDLQDLLCALLKVEFDEVATDEWTPPYTGGVPRTTLLVDRDQIAVVAKKTRSGLTTKELADQVAADSDYYRTQRRCLTLFCFMYDPEGRIGSPKRLETTLTSASEHCRIEVLVAPK